MSDERASEPRSAAAETPVEVAVGIGSNLGDRAEHLRAGREALAGRLSELRASRVYETDPVGAVAGGRFLNMCCVGRTTDRPGDLLAWLLAAERRAGRARDGPGGGSARTLDLDLLLYGRRRISTPRLEVPHPRMAGRAFVLRPLAELIPDAAVPGTGRSVGELARDADDEGIDALGELDELLEGADGAGT